MGANLEGKRGVVTNRISLCIPDDQLPINPLRDHPTSNCRPILMSLPVPVWVEYSYNYRNVNLSHRKQTGVCVQCLQWSQVVSNKYACKPLFSTILVLPSHLCISGGSQPVVGRLGRGRGEGGGRTQGGGCWS